MTHRHHRIDLRALPVVAARAWLALGLPALLLAGGCVHLSVLEPPMLPDAPVAPTAPEVQYRPADASLMQARAEDPEALVRPRLKLARATLGVWTEAEESLARAAQDEALRALLARGSSLVDLERAPRLTASWMRKSGSTTVQVEGGLESVIHFRPVLDADYVLVLRIGEPQALEIELSEEAFYSDAQLAAYADQHARFTAGADRWFEGANRAVEDYSTQVETEITAKRALAKEGRKTVPPWEVDTARRKARRLRDDAEQRVAQMRAARAATRAPEELIAALPSLARVEVGALQQVAVRGELIRPAGPDVAALWTIVAVAPDAEEAARLGVRHLAGEVAP